MSTKLRKAAAARREALYEQARAQDLTAQQTADLLGVTPKAVKAYWSLHKDMQPANWIKHRAAEAEKSALREQRRAEAVHVAETPQCPPAARLSRPRGIIGGYHVKRVYVPRQMGETGEGLRHLCVTLPAAPWEVRA